jgi:hypothetical protein
MDVRPGAYGYLIAGIDGGDMLAVGGAAAWPVLTVSTGIESRAGPRRVELGPNRASIDTLGARLVLEREPVSVTVLARSRLPEADLVHPSLWPAAAVFARWRGLETLHSGAFVDDRGGAWAVLGDRGAGKSSLLAALVLAGHSVVADDLLVIDGGDCFAGPRCVDLKPDAVTELGLGALPSVRCTERRRLVLAPCPGRFALRGCIYLEWGDRVAAEPLAPAEHLGLLAAQRRIAGLGANVEQLLGLSGLPAFRLRRPQARGWVDATTRVLIEAVRGTYSYFSPPSARPAGT